MEGHPLHVGRAVRAGAPRTEARRGRRLRLAEADEDRARRSRTAPTRRSRTSIRFRRSTRRSSRKLKDGTVFYPGSAHEPHGSAALLHDQRAFAGFEEAIKGSLTARQARRHHRVLEGPDDGPGGPDSRRRRSSTRSSAARLSTRQPTSGSPRRRGDDDAFTGLPRSADRRAALERRAADTRKAVSA